MLWLVLLHKFHDLRWTALIQYWPSPLHHSLFYESKTCNCKCRITDCFHLVIQRGWHESTQIDHLCKNCGSKNPVFKFPSHYPNPWIKDCLLTYIVVIHTLQVYLLTKCRGHSRNWPKGGRNFPKHYSSTRFADHFSQFLPTKSSESSPRSCILFKNSLNSSR